MATAPSAARVCLAACRRASQQLPPRAQYLARTTQQQRIPQQQQLRALSTTIPRNARKRDEEAEDDITKEELQQKLAEIDKESMEAVSPEHRRAMDEFVQLDGYKSYSHYVQSVFEKPKTLQEDRALQDELSKDIMGERPNRNSFWYDEDDPETYTEEHEEFNEDDITSMAHGKLDEIREMRHYARLAVWEMPLLAKMAKPFAPPTDKQVLRWRYTSYMGESHPAEKKVVVQFSPEDLKLTAVQTNKLKKLVGPRYNPSTGLVKMSCDNYEYQAQNKAYLQKLVDDIITSAKDPKDTFEDIPLDTRHHNTKTKPRFPKEWRMSDARRKQLDEMRQKAALADLQRAEQGLLVDGQKAIDAYLVQKAAQEQKEALLIEASPTKGKQAPKRR